MNDFKKAWNEQNKTIITPYQMERMLNLLPKYQESSINASKSYSDSGKKQLDFTEVALKIIHYITTGEDKHEVEEVQVSTPLVNERRSRVKRMKTEGA